MIDKSTTLDIQESDTIDNMKATASDKLVNEASDAIDSATAKACVKEVSPLDQPSSIFARKANRSPEDLVREQHPGGEHLAPRLTELVRGKMS